MSQCTAVALRSGERCRKQAVAGSEFCDTHGERLKNRCTAKSKQSGERCRQPAVPGHSVCYHHGAASGQAKRKARERILTEKARQIMATYGDPVDVDPVEAILNEIRWTAGHVEWLRSMVQALPPEEVAWGTAEEVDKLASEFPGTDTTRRAAPNVWVVLYQQERKHLVDVCEKAIKIGIEERRVRLEERAGQLIADLLNRIFADPELGLDAAAQAAARTVASRHLREAA